MDNFDKLLDEMAEECPFLAQLYNDFMAGEYTAEHLRWEYEHKTSFKNEMDQAKEKYLPILQDMGLFLN